MRLLNIEFKKIVGNKSFKVFSLLFLVFLPLLVILVPAMAGDTINGIDFYPFIPNNYETTWYAVSVISSWFCFFLLSFVLIYHITNEYNYRTVRQNVIDGYTRNEYIKGKIYLMLAITVIATLYVFVVGLIAGAYFSTFDPEDAGQLQNFFNTGEEIDPIVGFGSVLDGVENVGRFFVQVLANFGFAFLVAFLAKRGILAVLIYYAAYIAEIIVGIQLRNNNAELIYDYLPLNVISQTLPFPNFRMLLAGLTSPDTFNWLASGIALAYTLLFIGLARRLFMKRDIS